MGWTKRFTTILNTDHKIIKKENAQLTPESGKLIFFNQRLDQCLNTTISTHKNVPCLKAIGVN